MIEASQAALCRQRRRARRHRCSDRYARAGRSCASRSAIFLAVRVKRLPRRHSFTTGWRERAFAPAASAQRPSARTSSASMAARGAAPICSSPRISTPKSPSALPEQNAFRYRESTLADPEWTRSAGSRRGAFGVIPSRTIGGPMSCFLIAAKALKKARHRSRRQDLAHGLLGRDRAGADRGGSPGIDVQRQGHRRALSFSSWRRCTRLRHRARRAPTSVSPWLGCGYALFRIRLFGRGTVHADSRCAQRGARASESHLPDGAGHRGAACVEPVLRGAQRSGNARRALCSESPDRLGARRNADRLSVPGPRSWRALHRGAA